MNTVVNSRKSEVAKATSLKGRTVMPTAWPSYRAASCSAEAILADPKDYIQ